MSSDGSILSRYYGPDEEACYVADDAHLAARIVVEDDLAETQRQAQVAADLRMAAQLVPEAQVAAGRRMAAQLVPEQATMQEARQPPTVPAAVPAPAVSSTMTPMPMYNVLQKSELPVIAAKLEP